MRLAEIVQLRRTRPAHAPLRIEVGGYMKGERKKRKNSGGARPPPKKKTLHLEWVRRSCIGAACPERCLTPPCDPHPAPWHLGAWRGLSVAPATARTWRAGCSACPGTPALDPVPSHHRPLTRGFHGPIARWREFYVSGQSPGPRLPPAGGGGPGRPKALGIRPSAPPDGLCGRLADCYTYCKSIGRYPPSGDAEQLNLRAEVSSWGA